MAAEGASGPGAWSPGSVAAAASKHNVTSFQRRGPRASGTESGGCRLVSIAGTRPSVRNGQLLVSTGLPALDQLLGGGLAVGTVLLIEEDKYNTYSPLLFKYFLAEGIVAGHTSLVASAKEEPADILQGLPAPLLDDNCKKELGEDVHNDETSEFNNKMKIAWRYQLLPKMEAIRTAERASDVIPEVLLNEAAAVGAEAEAVRGNQASRQVLRGNQAGMQSG
ncbi:Elongator complex protein 4 [Myotis brandtii]|uniref:Elongator complex protein 4 n=1 Tax=Myotis brandtii TaxID=109478 RepID=S7PTX6_MYOBR|nr:Elongator complex protein 4 [Myotis brandtii]